MHATTWEVSDDQRIEMHKYNPTYLGRMVVPGRYVKKYDDNLQ